MSYLGAQYTVCIVESIINIYKHCFVMSLLLEGLIFFQLDNVILDKVFL